jgi:hypothetical protein
MAFSHKTRRKVMSDIEINFWKAQGRIEAELDAFDSRLALLQLKVAA